MWNRYWNTFWNLLLKHRANLLLLFVGVFLPLWGFGNLAEEVWEKEGFAWDVPILLFIHARAQPQIDFWASRLTQLGGFWEVAILAFLIALLLLVRQQWRALTFFLITVIGNGTINRVAKVLLHRVRPHLWNSPAPEYDYGFPSGHAMASMGLVAALVILSWRSPWRWWTVGISAVYVLMIGCTRLYLGVHYPSDVLAGWMASIAWAVGVSLLIRPVPAPPRRSRHTEVE